MRSYSLKLLAKNKSSFDRSINKKYNAERSIVLRYKDALKFGMTGEEDLKFKNWLTKSSIREGARVFPLVTYKGVEIYILDETTLMHTKTLKSIDGCIITAHCKSRGYERVLFESGGNTAVSLTEYGQKMGLETFCFIPEENIPLLNSVVFEPERAHLIAVKEPGLVKRAASLFGSMNGVNHIPKTEWRYDASTFRGLFILEYLLKNEQFDWLVQTISAAFGPIGIYRVLRNFSDELGGVPRFLGVQKEANCHVYKTFKSKTKENKPVEIKSTDELLSQVMYDAMPHEYGTYKDLAETLNASDGDLATINNSEFGAFLERNFDGHSILGMLSNNEVKITLSNGEVVEKTGLVALAGTLKEIDNKKISKYNKVLCCLTSGVYEADKKPIPERVISTIDDLDR
jgi:threonine synthase